MSCVRRRKEEYKRLGSGEECRIEAKRAIKELLERTMDSALTERLETREVIGRRRADRRNSYFERSLLTAFGYIEEDSGPTRPSNELADVVLPKYRRSQPEFDAAVGGSFLLGHST